MTLPKLLDTLGASKVFVVTENSLYTKVCLTNNPFRHPDLSHTTQTDVVKKVEGILREQNRYTATFYNIGEHSPISGIRAGVDVFKQPGAESADIIVSVGGGSPIDASKAIIYFLHQQLGGDFLRQIAIPTVQNSALRSILYGLFVTFNRCPNLNFLCERLAWDIPMKWVKRQLCARSTSHLRVSFSMQNLLLPLLKGCGESHLSFVRSIMCSMHTVYLLEYAPLTMLSRICISHS